MTHFYPAALRSLLRTFGVLLIGLFGQALAIDSTALRDVIRANGIGNIDLFVARANDKFIDGSVLEAFRLDNNGNLVFVIDVNEAANGTEKANSQGIAIDTVTLTVTIDGIDYSYTDFSTRTITLLAPLGQTTRSRYYTIIGDTGSNRITGNSASDINGSSYDATLSVPIDRDLSNATAATLVVRFLDVNGSLGDPETFYDYSNGFEDLALATRADAFYLDNLAPGQEQAPLVIPSESFASTSTNRLYFPSQSQFYLAAYEDLFPARGDYDFNDLVVAYRVYVDSDANSQVNAIGGEGFLVARGAAGYDHDWHLRIPLPATVSGNVTLDVIDPSTTASTSGHPEQFAFNGALDLTVFRNTRSLWVDPGFLHVNTLRQQGFIAGPHFNFHATLDAPLALTDMSNAPFDPYLMVHNTNYEIHLKKYAPVLASSSNNADGLTNFIDSAGFPFAMVLPDSWQVPVESTDLGLAYPGFINFISSGNIEQPDWYLNQDDQQTKATSKATWRWR